MGKLRDKAARTKGLVNLIEGDEAEGIIAGGGRTPKKAGARRIVQKSMNNMIKKGTVPGMPSPGRG